MYHLAEPLIAANVISSSFGWHPSKLIRGSLVEDMAALQPGDILFRESPSFYYLLRGETVSPFDDYTKNVVITSTFTITEYQQYVVDKYSVFSEDPDLEGAGGGRVLPGEPGRDLLPLPVDPVPFVAIIAAVAAIGLVVFKGVLRI